MPPGLKVTVDQCADRRQTAPSGATEGSPTRKRRAKKPQNKKIDTLLKGRETAIIPNHSRLCAPQFSPPAKAVRRGDRIIVVPANEEFVRRNLSANALSTFFLVRQGARASLAGVFRVSLGKT